MVIYIQYLRFVFSHDQQMDKEASEQNTHALIGCYMEAHFILVLCNVLNS